MRFEVRRITDGDRRRKKLLISRISAAGMHDPVMQTGEWLKGVLNGYYRYHAVPAEFDGAETIPATGRP